MYISHINNVVQEVEELEWQCRREAKGFNKAEYWTWLETVTSGDPPVADYSGETGYTIVECAEGEENVRERLRQLEDYIDLSPFGAGKAYNVKWSDSKVSAVIQNDAGDDVTIQTHFSGDDTARDARLLADKWIRVRRDRDTRIAETDYLALSDTTLTAGMTTYRQKLRDVPAQSDPDNISWPVKPS